MKPQIKDIFCPDVPDFDLEAWVPSDPKQIYILLELSIGQAWKTAADLFQIVIATPQAIQGRPQRRFCKLLVVQHYHWPEVRATLERWVAECEKPNWDATVDCLRAKFHWEFEGMRHP